MDMVVPAYPFPRACPFSPPPNIERLRIEAPITKVELYDGSIVWVATRYEDVRQLLGDNRLSVDPSRPNYPFPFPSRKATLLNIKRSFLWMDPPEHGQYRRMLTKEFTVRRIEAMRAPIQRIVNDLIAKIEAKGPPADLVEDFGISLPSMVISELLGVPYEDHAFFQECTKARLDGGLAPEQAVKAAQQIIDYLDQLVTRKEAAPGNGEDLLARLVIDQVLPGKLTHDEAVAMADLILQAGHETTGNAMGMAFAVLLQHPDKMAALRENPSLAPQAVEELLRFITPTHTHSLRTATADVAINGRTIKAGEGVISMLYSANWDPSVFPDAGELDFDRDASHHVAFGYGVHQCLGQSLARLEMQIALATLLPRWPDFRLAVPVEALRFRADGIVYGPKTLPVTW